MPRFCRSQSRTSARILGRTAGARVARYYDATTAQFLTRDPLESATGSPYGYASGDPIDGSDPAGLCSVFSFGDDGCLAAAAAAVPGGDTLDNALTSAVSFGDQVTFGASHWVRHQIGLGGAVDECSSAYNNQFVTVASTVFMFADGEGEAAVAKSLATSGDLRALQALVAEAESAGSVTRADAEVLLKWADETGVTNMHGLDVPHLRDTPWRDIPHIKVFGVHLPVVG